MHYAFTSRSGIEISRRTTRLDFAAGIAHLIERLDTSRGAFFSSGVEYPDRYTRWDFGFVDPPVEIIAHGRRISFTALNPRGVRLLDILEPVVAMGEGTTLAHRDDRHIELAIDAPQDRFAEEARSRQPSAMTPLRRLIEDFAGIEDGFLGFYGAFGYDLIFQFDNMDLNHRRGQADRALHLYLADQIYVLDRRLETALRHDYVFSIGRVTTARAGRTPFAPLPAVNPGKTTGAVKVDQSDADYASQVEVARERIVAGDVFEIVLSREFQAPYTAAPSSLFKRFRELSPSPYEFFIQLGEEALVGASPEMFVRVEGDRIESSPIAGTARRSGEPMADADAIRRLLNSEKDEAELTMCTDVDRNDKARICEPGSVRLLNRRLIERYAGLFHTVDHVEGRLRSGFTGIDAFLSHMWAVTLTGAPKRKAVSLIEAMEAAPRRWYGGAIGGLALNGSVNTGITIRTAILSKGVARYRAGASLVYDSVGAEEARETELKATAFFAALRSDTSKASARAPAARTSDHQPRIVMIDNEDSFVHCLADYFRQAGAEVETYRWGLPASEIAELGANLVVHSPGPGRPEDFGLPGLVRALAGLGVPQFGVCLGLQGIAEAFGGALALLSEPRHGKVWKIAHDGSGLFAGLPTPLVAGAYHSLHTPENTLPPELEVAARSETGLVMALAHRKLPIAGVQFHPESILSLQEGAGLALVGNVLASVAGAA
ncbi:MAG: anthranilate synthase component I [Alphaproteobacteria bacterium]|nr:anthranilate synthase component I [Alphaproteobacteria bacterium]